MDERKIENPIWVNDDKTQVMCSLITDRGKFMCVISKSNPGDNADWDLVRKHYTEEHIDENTIKNFNVSERAKLQKFEEYKLNVDKHIKEKLFNIKAEAFDIDFIKNSTNRELKNKLRRSKNILEAQIVATILYQEEFNKLKAS